MRSKFLSQDFRFVYLLQAVCELYFYAFNIAENKGKTRKAVRKPKEAKPSKPTGIIVHVTKRMRDSQCTPPQQTTDPGSFHSGVNISLQYTLSKAFQGDG